jgi:hypothetical protein
MKTMCKKTGKGYAPKILLLGDQLRSRGVVIR